MQSNHFVDHFNVWNFNEVSKPFWAKFKPCALSTLRKFYFLSLDGAGCIKTCSIFLNLAEHSTQIFFNTFQILRNLFLKTNKIYVLMFGSNRKSKIMLVP